MIAHNLTFFTTIFNNSLNSNLTKVENFKHDIIDNKHTNQYNISHPCLICNAHAIFEMFQFFWDTGFVNGSTLCSSVLTKVSLISPSLKRFLTKWWQSSMCFDLTWRTWFFVIAIVDILSHNIFVELSGPCYNFSRILRS